MWFIFLSMFSKAQNNYDKYCNSRFEYCIEYPTELKGMGESGNGDGQKFISKDNKATLIVYRDSRIGDFENIAECKADCFRNDSQIEAGKNVTYKKEGNNFFVVSGYRGNNIFYQKTIFRNGEMVTAVIEYSTSKKAKYNAYCTYLFNNFK